MFPSIVSPAINRHHCCRISIILLLQTKLAASTQLRRQVKFCSISELRKNVRKELWNYYVPYGPYSLAVSYRFACRSRISIHQIYPIHWILLVYRWQISPPFIHSSIYPFCLFVGRSVGRLRLIGCWLTLPDFCWWCSKATSACLPIRLSLRVRNLKLLFVRGFVFRISFHFNCLKIKANKHFN